MKQRQSQRKATQLDIPANKARQGVTGMKVRYVLAASTAGALLGIAVAYALVI